MGEQLWGGNTIMGTQLQRRGASVVQVHRNLDRMLRISLILRRAHCRVKVVAV
jgi:hypothetical protein